MPHLNKKILVHAQENRINLFHKGCCIREKNLWGMYSKFLGNKIDFDVSSN